jgi:hypothetical protein
MINDSNIYFYLKEIRYIFNKLMISSEDSSELETTNNINNTFLKEN